MKRAALQNKRVGVLRMAFRVENISGHSRNWLREPVSRKPRELLGTKKPVIKLQSACFEKLVF